MYCSNCGKKIKENIKFCPFCGASTKEQKKVEETPPPVTSTTPPTSNVKKKNNGCVVALTIFLVLTFFSMLIAYLNTSSNNEALLGIMGLLVFVLLILILIAVAKKIVKMGVKKPKAALIVLGILILILIPSYFAYQSYSYNQIAERTAFIEDKVTEIAAAKLLGDTLMKSGAIPATGVTLQNINDAASTEKNNLSKISYPSSLATYLNSVTAWADKIAAAKDFTSWEALTDEPEKFDIQISDSWATGIFKQTFFDLAAIKDAGDYAIKTKDRSAMRFVAARLVAIDNLFTSLETYQTVALKDQVISPAYADYVGRGGAVIRTRSLCFLNGKATTCLDKAREATSKARQAAQKLYEFTPPEKYSEPDNPESQTNWDSAFSGIEDGIDEANLQHLGGVGITNGEPATEPQLPNRAQAFYNECKARGGNPNPSSLVKERLPTTENGYNCQIGGCWEFLTANSGRRYAGGNPGCPEIGLTPRPIPTPTPKPNLSPTPNPTPTPTPTSYDGTYSIRYSYGSCGTNLPVNLGSIGAFDDTITVRNNVVNFGVYTAKIDSNGRATWSNSLNGIGHLQQIFNFTRSGVSGTFSFRVSTQGASVGCNGSFSGSKH